MGSLRDAITERLGRGGDEQPVTTGAESSMVDLATDIAENPQTVELRDGRQMGYTTVGDPDGDPLFVFHGFPNSRVFGALFDEVAREYGMRVIAPERPGFGVSDPQPDRELTDWPADVADVADALGVERFSVLGISGGGPYTVATAALLGDRVEHAAVGCGVGPMCSVGISDRLWYYTARFFPPGSKLALWLLGRQARDDRDAFLEEMADAAAPADEDHWTGEIGKVIHASMIESRRHHGLDPLVRETAIFGSPWNIDLGEIDVPMSLWYGKSDVLVPPEMGLHLATAIPTAEAHVYPDLDHLSTIDENEDAMFERLSG